MYSIRTSNFFEGGDCHVARLIVGPGLGVQAIRVDLHFIENHLHTIQPFAHVL